MLYKLDLTFEPADEILKCDHSNKSYQAALSCSTVYYAVKGGSNFESVDEILKCDHANESYQAALSCGAVCFAKSKWKLYKNCNSWHSYKEEN